MSYDFYFNHNMPAVEWILNAMIIKNESLTNKLNRSWRQPLIKKLEHIPFSNEQ